MILDDLWINALWSIIPTLAISAVFWFVLRGILRADRNERAAYARIEKDLRAERAAQAAAAHSGMAPGSDTGDSQAKPG
ncbi:hypothetical protein ACIPV2_00425 [Microbacterium sp. NPDC089987]|uniref:hypothetical protein n=1 Tax=Microbacterium sp. NPDC089987 TaxID=3364202 RepID=UPI00380E2AD3